MLRIEVLDRDGTALTTVDAPPGERLLDVLDETRAPVPFGCRSATCGICLLEVVVGGELLASPDAIERVALDELDAAPGDRLGCRATTAPATAPVTGAIIGVVQVRPRTSQADRR